MSEATHISLPDVCEHITRMDIIRAKLAGSSNTEIFESIKEHQKEYHSSKGE